MDEIDSTKIVELFAAVKEDYRTFLSQNTLKNYLRIIETNAIIRTLEETNYRQNFAAEKLGISLFSLRSKIDKYSMYLEKIPVSADYLKHSWGCSLDEFLELVERIIDRIKMDMKTTSYNKNIEANQNEQKETNDNRNIAAVLMDREPNQNEQKENNDNRDKAPVLMDKEVALKIISMIVDGLDPYGEEDPSKNLPEDNPVTMRAVCTAIISLLSIKDREDLKPKYGIKKYEELMKTVSGPLEGYLREKEKEKIVSVLYDVEYDLNKAAEILGITYEKLRERINFHQISKSIILKTLGLAVETDFLELFIKRYWEKTITLDQYLGILEKNAVKKALEKTNHNKLFAAEKLGITFRSFRYKIDKIKLNKNVAQYKLDDRIKSDFFKYSENLSFDDFFKALEKKMINLALQKTNNNKNRAADLLGITFRSLRYRIDNFGIK
jgi:DNA-binding NtrC family response regulator